MRITSNAPLAPPGCSTRSRGSVIGVSFSVKTAQVEAHTQRRTQCNGNWFYRCRAWRCFWCRSHWHHQWRGPGRSFWHRRGLGNERHCGCHDCPQGRGGRFARTLSSSQALHSRPQRPRRPLLRQQSLRQMRLAWLVAPRTRP